MMSTNRLRKLSVAITALALTASATACSAAGPAGEKKANSEGPLVIGHSYQNITDEFFATELQTEREMVKGKGWELVSTDAQSNPARQLDDINTLISRRVDVLVIDPIDPDAVVPGITAANQAGIPVLSLIREPSRGKIDGLINLDSVQDGRNGCEYIAQQLKGKGNVVNLTGPLQTQAARERAEGCNDALKNHPDIKVVAQPSTDYTLRDGEQKMTDVLQAHPDIDAVFGGNDQIALGAVRAFIAAGKDPKQKVVVGVDGTKSGLQAVCDGTMKMSLATFSNTEAELVVQSAEKLRAGKNIGKILFAAKPVTASNVVDEAKVAAYELNGCKAGTT